MKMRTLAELGLPAHGFSEDDARAALAARRALHQGLAALADAGESTPCQSEGVTAAWVTEDPELQKITARACRACPVMARCREYAVAAQEPAGTWGGQTAGQRGLELRRAKRRAAAERRELRARGDDMEEN